MKYEIKCLKKSKNIKNIITFTNEWHNSPERLLDTDRGQIKYTTKL